MLSSLVHSAREQGIAQFPFWAATSFGDWDAFIEIASHWPIQGGTKRLLDAIVDETKAELRLSTPVTAIEDDGSGVTVTTREGERLGARRAVAALPLNALSDVTIAPPVPRSVRTMIEQKQPMKTLKIWARVKGEIEPFAANAPVGKHPINTARTEYRHDGDTSSSASAPTPRRSTVRTARPCSAPCGPSPQTSKWSTPPITTG